MLLGRAIKQEVIPGFEYAKPAPKPEFAVKKPLTKEEIKEVAKKRYEEKTGEPQEKKYDKPYDKTGAKKDFKKDFKKDSGKPESAGKWDKQKKETNKFLGKDENGKAIFSGKSGERNHRHDGSAKEKFDAPKKVGRTINIKAREPKEEK
jgi:hypothetical protein